MCVCDLVLLLSQRQPYVSQHLAKLREEGLVTGVQDGRNVRYRLVYSRQPVLLQLLRSLDSYATKVLTHKERGDNMSSSQNSNWNGIPRAEIDWHPTILAEYCIGCGLCATSCGRGVYAFDYEQHVPVVVKPLMCMVGCTTCANLCPQDAIVFPPRGYVRALIKKNKLLRRSKDLLNEQREKYDEAVRVAPAG